MLDASGGLVEQVRYSSYGVPYGLPAGDTDSDGDFDSADVTAITGGYDVRKDANLDGTINVFDVLHASNIAGGGGTVTTGRDVLGSPDNANRFGYGAYLRDPAVPQWHVRHRVFRSDIGRWLTRDPAGYVDGLSLYEYAMSGPTAGLDPSGLDSLGGRWIWPEGQPDRTGERPRRRSTPRPNPQFELDHDDEHSPGQHKSNIHQIADAVEQCGPCGTTTIATHSDEGVIDLGVGEDGLKEYLTPQELRNIKRMRRNPNLVYRHDLERLRRLDDSLQRIYDNSECVEWFCCKAGGGRDGQQLGELLRELYGGKTILYKHNVRYLPFGIKLRHWHPFTNPKRKFY
ncbi:MAG: RHS repeat-associated core domain-containing protein [Phycisphaerales bacterium]